jgi:hypothetical protein
MEDAADSKLREIWERLVLLLIARPRDGWEPEFEEITNREIERLAVPVGRSAMSNAPRVIVKPAPGLTHEEAARLRANPRVFLFATTTQRITPPERRPRRPRRGRTSTLGKPLSEAAEKDSG